MSKRNNEVKKKTHSTKYRFAILNDTTHEFIFSLFGTKAGAIITAIGVFLVLSLVIFCIVAFTGVRLLIPGYPSYESQKIALENAKKVDSLEKKVRIYSLQFTNINRIIEGKQPYPVEYIVNKDNKEESAANDENHYIADSIMREKVDSVEKYTLSQSTESKQLEGTLFFPPVKGAVTQEYNTSNRHPFIDIAIKDNSTIHATLDGTVIAAFWDKDTGYNIYIQHANDLISVYKHNTKLLVDVGDHVIAGATISLAGNAGSISTGPHLHFELWHKGEPVSPSLYINF